ncbi:MAG: winged helix DNA-binding domain-containing protein [Hamadaea sp.]|uniref:winged helix DNA-binding domain-containing protein n=1 Tax=Hamadaea sp. TaxID=2024425 RepID=UPI0017E6CAE9|nr:winged helix DNA-binding domain-containing protein [Hamadaea sp.]NUR72365.1 winged helix DNA-binding domain-containing protein [Hamadaea sp.]NUT20266.1 winged helix DNA-binding domain-containing protein [Hamadaea sp.]
MRDDEVLRRRYAAQGLADPAGPTVVEVAGRLAGLQAQDTAAMRLAVRARTRDLTADGVREECSEPGEVARTWLMRGTLHLVPAVDVRWMLSIFGARNVAATKGRRDQLGLDDKTCDKALAKLPGILRGRALSRAEIVRELGLDLRGQAVPHLMAYAAGRGLICRGPDLDKDEPGYVLLDEWAPAGKQPTDPLAELARRYQRAFGPATTEDFATWSGLPIGAVREPFQAAAYEREEGSGTRLLGAYDTYLLGYRDRSLMLDPAYAHRIQAGGGVLHPAVVVDGRVVGRWRIAKDRLEVEAFDDTVHKRQYELTAEAADVGRFLGRPTDLRITVTQPS